MTEQEYTIAKILVGTLLGSGIAALITVWRTKYTVLSSDFSKRIVDASELIDEMAECSSRIWAKSAGSDPLKYNKHYVIGLKSRLSTLIHSLEENYRGVKIKSVMDAYIVFSQASTGGEFSSENISAEYQISHIQNSAEILKSELYKVRRNKY